MANVRTKILVQDALKAMQRLSDSIWMPLAKEQMLSRGLSRIELIAGGWSAELSHLIEQMQWEIEADIRDQRLSRLVPPSPPPSVLIDRGDGGDDEEMV